MNKTMVVLVLCLTLILSMCVRGNEPNDTYDVNNIIGLTVHVSSELTLGRTNAKLWIGGQKGNSEVGLNAGMMDELSPDDTSYSFGVYALYHLPDVRTIVENTLWPIEWLPQELEAEPSVGLSVEYFDESVITVNPMVVIKVMDFLETMIIYNPTESELPYQNRVTVGIGKLWQF